MSCYLLAFKDTLNMSTELYYFFFGLMVMGGVLFAIKKLMSVLQLIGSAQTIAERDLEALVTEGEKKKE